MPKNIFNHPHPTLYLIADRELLGEAPIAKLRSILGTGVDIVQYRDKESSAEERSAMAKQVAEACDDYHTPLIINDDPELASAVRAAGVHLGKDDMSIADARALLGKEMLIGASCYDSAQRSQKALVDGADYLAFGAVFSTRTKENASRISLSQLQECASYTAQPICAIGGITTENVSQVLACGATIIAVGRGILAEADPQKAVYRFKQLLEAKPEIGR